MKIVSMLQLKPKYLDKRGTLDKVYIRELDRVSSTRYLPYIY